MPITKEEADKIKEHLLKQLDNFPEDRREQITNQINSMTKEQVENFIQQNKLTHLGGQCIFCSIVANKTPSYKIAKNEDNIAILEINPLSKGHSLVVPKEHLEELPQSAKDLAQEVAQKLQETFSPSEIQIKELKIMNHPLIEVVPIYGNDTPMRQNSGYTERRKKQQASEEELKELQKEITKPKKIEINNQQSTISDEVIPILPPRIP
ncbi:MAG: HIT domain-containing protein [archaeon]